MLEEADRLGMPLGVEATYAMRQVEISLSIHIPDVPPWKLNALPTVVKFDTVLHDETGLTFSGELPVTFKISASNVG